MAQQPMKKVLINHDLAKALMNAGIHHFDSGGIMSGITNALTPTSGYSAQLAPIDTLSYQGNILNANQNSSQGYGNFQNVANQQQGLADQLKAQTLGQGPNPAQAALNQNTGANIANTAALMAGQRGASVNPALIARQAAQAGAGIQQNAVGQGATMQAQQQLAAQQLLAQQQAQQQAANVAEQNANTNLLGTNISGQNAQNMANISNYGMAQGINAQTAAANAKAQENVGDKILGGIGNVFKSIPIIGGLFSKGGNVPDHLREIANIYHAENFKRGGNVPGKPTVSGAVNTEKNDTVPALLSPGEVVIPRSITQSPDAANKAAEFIRHLQKQGSGKSDLHESLKKRRVS